MNNSGQLNGKTATDQASNAAKAAALAGGSYLAKEAAHHAAGSVLAREDIDQRPRVKAAAEFVHKSTGGN